MVGLLSGLRKVYPYYFTFTTFTKGRWVGERILDVFAREFRAHPAEEYERCILAGTLTVNYEKVPTDYKLKHNDLLANVVHRYVLRLRFIRKQEDDADLKQDIGSFLDPEDSILIFGSDQGSVKLSDVNHHPLLLHTINTNKNLFYTSLITRAEGLYGELLIAAEKFNKVRLAVLCPLISL